jgi:hypothetical protein
MHVRRPAQRRAKPAPAVKPAVPVYEPGFFMALVRQHDWPPRFEPQMESMTVQRQIQLAAAARGREVANATGVGWGNGTIVLPNTPHNLRPGMMRWRA